jgi:16S rRNA (cytosine967-C5)-methyltransferase
MSDKMRGRLYSLLIDYYGKKYREDYFQDAVMRRFYRKLYFEIFRNLGTIEKALGRFTEFRPSPELMAALVMGTAQLLYMNDVPDYAAVNESVELVGKNKRGFVNALLRKIIANREEILAGAVERDNFPAWLADRWKKRYGNNAEKIMAAYNEAPPLYALNVKELTVDEVEEYDEDAEDLYYMDKASAMIPLLAGGIDPASVLDCCAAPGGKTIILGRKYPEAVVFAVEINPKRFETLEENIERFDLENVQPVNNDIMKLEGEEAFDLILLDAPCTAIGTMRKHPEIRWLRTERQIAEKAKIQQEMLSKVSTLLAKKGRLIYSVCTTEPEETTEIISGFLEENPDFRTVKPACPDEFIRGECFVSDPSKSNCDGFFAAVLEKR